MWHPEQRESWDMVEGGSLGRPHDRPQGGSRDRLQNRSRDVPQGGSRNRAHAWSRDRPQGERRDQTQGRSRDRLQSGSRVGPQGEARDRAHRGSRDRPPGGSRSEEYRQPYDRFRGESSNEPHEGSRKRGQGGSWDRLRARNVNNCQRVKFGLRNLQSIIEKSPDEMVLDMTSERCLPATDALLKQRDMDDELIVQLLKVLSRACDCETAQARLTKLLSLLPTSIYFSRHLSNYIIRWGNSDHLESKEHENELKDMIKVFSELIKKQPSCYPHLPLPQLSYTTKHLIDKGVLCNQDIETAVEELMALKDEMAEKVKKEVEEMGKNPRRQRRINEAALRDNEAPPDDFRQLSVTPTIEDIHNQRPVFLRRNKVDGKYNDPEHYLDVQFRLLREDFVRPLREGIQQLLEKVESGNLKHLQDVRVYTGIRVLYPIFTPKGLTHMISFDVSKMKNVRWENSKRLINGSLLCLSKDNFETFLLAIVESREEESLKKGMLEVRFTDALEANDLGKVEYQMVETTAYFEAYRHVLEGLKYVKPETLPFQRYIVECENDIEPPAYLRNRMKEEVTYDLSPIMKKRKYKRRARLVQDQSQDQKQQRDLSQNQDRDRDNDQDQNQNQDLDRDKNQDQNQNQDLDRDKDQDQNQNQDLDRDKDQDQNQNLDLGLLAMEDQNEDQDQDQNLDLGLLAMEDQNEDQDRDQNLDLGLLAMEDQNQDQDKVEDRCKDHDRDQNQERKKEYGKAVRILDMNSWPSAEDLELDSSQLKAVQLALTKEFTIIQGPPGTGKTYIGLKVVKVLLHNKRQWDRGTEKVFVGGGEIREKPARPILVVCYTNHALDQFLEGILKFHAKRIVRVGGRCKSEEINKFNLSNIKHEMHKEKKIPPDVYRAVQEAKENLKIKSSELETAARNLRKCKENIIHERELKKENVMSHEQFESMISRFKDHYSRDPSAVTVNSVMLHWLNLLPDPYEARNSPGLNVKPVAKFVLDSVHGVNNLVFPSHMCTAVVNQVDLRPGLHGRRYGSSELKGKPDSYIMIPNGHRGILDTRFSMTILMYVYPMNGRGGPILCFYHPESGFIGIKIDQNGIQNGKGVISVSFNSRDGRWFRPLSKAVLNLNEWNFIATSYDHNTGYTRLWHNGVMVQEKQYPRIEIASNLAVFIGSLNLPFRRQCFRGRICCLEIYAQALCREQIMAVAGIREEDLQTEEEKADTDVQMEAAAIQEQRWLFDESRSGNQNEDEADKTIQIADQFDNTGNKQRHFRIDLSNSQQNRIRQTIMKELSNRATMRIPEAKSVKDVWKLKLNDRWRLYRRWIIHLSSRFRNAVTRNQREFELSAQELKEAHNLEDLCILKTADVIGMTTTGAAKYRHLIQQIKPRITIVEEAAEVLEAHIVTSLSPGCQHLILIGDHQQLRPNPNVYRLATDYNLDVSLFERMVKNGMKIERLRAQHRMRPEIARMMEPIYEDLENHESVLNFENIKGVSSNIFFIEHTELEELIEEGMSRSNIHEAKYLAALCRYFILQGYENQQITILTMYTGQLIQLKKELNPKEFFRGVRVCAVDNFQGEENDIILLSLVRSNEEGSIGFLRTSNRVCVALSRAKKGFFCIGNLELMCGQKESLWKHIIDDMRSKEKVGPYLTLMCQNHPKTIIRASKPEDFRKAPEGGCTEPCKARLECGHVCKLHCHPTDPDHIEYQCNEKCLKTCELKHKCKQRCYEECDPCDVLVPKEIPSCGHIQEVPCYRDPAKSNCLSPCESTCVRGHKCKQRCYEECDPCDVLVLKEIPSCGHIQEVPCYRDPAKSNCLSPCESTCVRGHKCKQRCYEECDPCDVLVLKEIPSCKHKQKVPCYMDPADFKCKAPCERTCVQGHKCKQRCFEKCKPCGLLVSKTIPLCEHVQEVPCHLDPGNFSCKGPCKRSCELGHKCRKLCHETCGPCDFLVQKKMPLCDHYQEVPCHVDVATVECQAPCERPCDKGHRDCKLLCHQECQPCNALTSKTIPPCNHNQQVPCYMPPQDFKCQAQCSKNLPCSHPCQNKCSVPCNSKCRHIVSKKLPCGHQKELECCKKPEDVSCTASCDALLKCNHSCKGNCSQCLCGRLHKACSEKCGKVLFCGHSCPDICAKNCPPCQKKCDNKCAHGNCKKKCREPCNPCTKPCNWRCQHHTCTKLCSEPCDRPRCDKPCRKKPFKKCRHRCIGMCGEPCPKKCRVCDKEEVTQDLFGNESNENARFVEVQPCSHVIEVKAMDKWVDDGVYASSTTLQLIRCPRCRTPIKTCARYGSIIKAMLIDLEKVKAKTAVDKKELNKIAARLKTKMSKQLVAKSFPNEAKHVAKSLDRKDITQDHLNMCENQIHFMNCLSQLLIDGDRVQRGRRSRGIKLTKVMTNLKSDVLDLVSRVVVKGRANFSDQETDEMYSAMQRVSLVFLYEVCKRELAGSSLGDIKKAVESRTQVDEAVFHLYKKKLENKLSIRISEDPWRPLKDEDKVVKVIYLIQEHWAKCPEGHVYHIHECGVDTEGCSCPECESKTLESTSA